MHLGDQRRAITLQPFDDVHLPQRAVGVERAAHGATPRTRRAPPGHPAKEGWPGRGGRPIRNRGRPPTPGDGGPTAPAGPVAGRGPTRWQSLRDDAADLRVPRGRREERTRALGRVQDHHHAHVQRGRRRLERQEGRVQPSSGCITLRRIRVPCTSCPGMAEAAGSPRRLTQAVGVTSSNAASSTAHDDQLGDSVSPVHGVVLAPGRGSPELPGARLGNPRRSVPAR